MKIKSVFALLLFGITLVSCTEKEKWPEESKVEFVNSCESAFIESFTAGVGDLINQVDPDKLKALAKNTCSCQYDNLKSNYESAEEAFSKSAAELIANSANCEPNDDDIADLLE